MPLATLLLLLIIMAVTQYAGAQTPIPPQSNVNNYNYNIDNYNDDDGAPYRDNFNAATAILVVVLVSAFFFLAFLSLYFRRCSRDRSAIAAAVAAGAVTTSRRGARREGLNPAILETFPTLAYSDVTQLKVGKESLECAVCLSEFTNDETLRMLPRCCHVFHPECIDTWLQTHVTCPVCRDNLAVVPTEEEEASYQVPRLGGERETEESSSDQRAVIVDIARMGRSHSTGHVSGGGGADRFTLRLPEHVRREIVGEGMMLRRSASVAVVSAVGRRNMEGEDGEGSWRRRGLIRAGLSGRWTSGILSRVTSTWRKREEGSGSGSVKRVEMKSEGSLKAAGMFDCLGGGTRSDSRDDEPISRNVNESKEDTTSVLDRV